MFRKVDIEVHDPKEGTFSQARYLVHGHDDVLWTDSLDDALEFVRESLLPEND